VDNDRGRSAGLSNQVEVPEMAVSQIADAHADLTSNAVVVSAEVTPVSTGVKQTLELRRREKGSPQESNVAQIAVPESSERVQLRDGTFDWEKTYEYRVIVSADAILPNGPEVRFDGAISAPLEVVAHDVFPPAVPSGVQAVYSGMTQPSTVDLTWNPDTDRDLAGYFVYRRAAAGTSAAVKLNNSPLPAPTFSDSHITAGATYFYSVSAVDIRGNESQRSHEASESIPN
jgi:predicted phage tail protein